MFERRKTGERALLVNIKFRDPRQTPDFAEFKELAISAGAVVIATISTKRDPPDPKYLLGKGKAEEIAMQIQTEQIELVLVNYTLTPSQERNLEQLFSCRVLDRTGLILDIFAQRARSFEGKLQVELAQLQHLATRLVRGWSHLERQRGGIGLRGPGETQLEIDRRLIQTRIKSLKQRLDKVRAQRAQSRRARQKANIATVALVGYTNAGKSTLFNALTEETIYAANKLFATLDPTLRSIQVPIIGKVIIADTVGFIRELPHNLIEAFRATLEETKDADLLLHVIDSADLLWEDRKHQVEAVLHEIGAKQVPILAVYNKIDLVEKLNIGVKRDMDNKICAVRVSATKKQGLQELLTAISERLCYDIVRGSLKLAATQARERALLYAIGAVDQEISDDAGNWLVQIATPRQYWQQVCAKFPKLADLLQQP